ncbi:hypothetical protein HYU40_00555 [Candidatus Woesearchaeota archaeon]|nr:hypothetical protein [Candidatus Woesearchaeota archaeon]
MLRRRVAKNAQVASATVLATFAVAVLILFLVVFKITTSVVRAQDIVQACHLSTILSSWQLQKDILVTNWEIMDSPFFLDCKTIFTEITKDSINRAEFPISFGKDATPEQKKEKLKDAVMQQMAECWYMYGQGKAKVQQAVETEEGKTTCIVCSEIIPTKEFVEDMQKNSPDVLTLDKMYAYAASNNVPPQNSKSYLDYMLENAKTRPDVLREGEMSKPGVNYVVEPTKITLDKRYSVVFAIADQTEHLFALLGRGGVIKADTGIVGCNLGGYGENPAKGDFAEAIGCNKDGTNKDGLIFGKVIDGGRHDELLSWRNLPGFNLATGGSAELKRFPMTVRLVPTDEMVKGDFCSRLY